MSVSSFWKVFTFRFHFTHVLLAQIVRALSAIVYVWSVEREWVKPGRELKGSVSGSCATISSLRLAALWFGPGLAGPGRGSLQTLKLCSERSLLTHTDPCRRACNMCMWQHHHHHHQKACDHTCHGSLIDAGPDCLARTFSVWRDSGHVQRQACRGGICFTSLPYTFHTTQAICSDGVKQALLLPPTRER